MELVILLDESEIDDMGYGQPETPKEVNLWRAVLLRAIRDAIGEFESKHPLNKAKQVIAQQWFYEADHDFVSVCNYAGLEPEYVQFSVLDYLTKSDQKTVKVNPQGKRADLKKAA